jgi:putative phosphoesterase
LRIAVLSDTHVPTRASGIPGRIYEVCSECDLAIHAGDFVEEHVLVDLERLAPVRGVLGNMDDFALARILPKKLDIELEGFRICVAHGHGTPLGLEERVLAMFQLEPDVMIFGHSHSWMQEMRGKTLLLNPGAACGSVGRRSMAVLTLIKGEKPAVEQIVF